MCIELRNIDDEIIFKGNDVDTFISFVRDVAVENDDNPDVVIDYFTAKEFAIKDFITARRYVRDFTEINIRIETNEKV